MSKNYYSEINLHIVWHTKESQPLLTPTIEPIVYRELRRRIVAIDRRIETPSSATTIAPRAVTETPRAVESVAASPVQSG